MSWSLCSSQIEEAERVPLTYRTLVSRVTIFWSFMIHATYWVVVYYHVFSNLLSLDIILLFLIFINCIFWLVEKNPTLVNLLRYFQHLYNPFRYFLNLFWLKACSNILTLFWFINNYSLFCYLWLIGREEEWIDHDYLTWPRNSKVPQWEEVRAISKIPISLTKREDKRIWAYTKSGQYTVKSGYHQGF